MSRSAAEAAGLGRGAAARVSIWESLRGCGIFGKEINKESLRVSIWEYLCAVVAAAAATRSKSATSLAAASTTGDEAAPEAPAVVFVNTGGRGRHGPWLKLWLPELMSQEQTFKNQLMQSLSDDNLTQKSEAADIEAHDHTVTRVASRKGCPRIDGKEFFRQARTRLSYEKFATFFGQH